MIAALLFVIVIAATNVALKLFGVVPVGFGLLAPAGVYLAGLTFTIRDFIPSRRLTFIAIAAGALLTAAISQQLALASGAAFATSELLDYVVYSRVRRRGWMPAVIFSNIAGSVVDSALFLVLAFGSLDFLAGNVIGKLWMTALALPIVWALHRARVADPAPA